MKHLAILFLLLFVHGASAVTLADFRYGSRTRPTARLASIAECEQTLATWPTPAEFDAADDVMARAETYFDAWRAAASGIEYVKATTAELHRIDEMMKDIFGRLDLPPAQMRRFDDLHFLTTSIRRFEGYTASDDELTAFQDELFAEINAFPLGDDPVAEVRERWISDIMMLSQATALAHQRGDIDFEMNPDLLDVVAALGGPAQED